MWELELPLLRRLSDIRTCYVLRQQRVLATFEPRLLIIGGSHMGSPDDDSKSCSDCKSIREGYQAAGVAVFALSMMTFGMLMPITIPLTIFLVLRSTRRCKNCRGLSKVANQRP